MSRNHDNRYNSAVLSTFWKQGHDNHYNSVLCTFFALWFPLHGSEDFFKILEDFVGSPGNHRCFWADNHETEKTMTTITTPLFEELFWNKGTTTITTPLFYTFWKKRSPKPQGNHYKFCCNGFPAVSAAPVFQKRLKQGSCNGCRALISKKC